MKERTSPGAGASPPHGDAVANDQPGLDRATQAKIGQQIAKAYEHVLKQELPDRFRDLLNRYDESGKPR